MLVEPTVPRNLHHRGVPPPPTPYEFKSGRPLHHNKKKLTKVSFFFMRGRPECSLLPSTTFVNESGARCARGTHGSMNFLHGKTTVFPTPFVFKSGRLARDITKRDWQKPTSFCYARPTGFEPAIFAVTERRVNRATPRPHETCTKNLRDIRIISSLPYASSVCRTTYSIC